MSPTIGRRTREKSASQSPKTRKRLTYSCLTLSLPLVNSRYSAILFKIIYMCYYSYCSRTINKFTKSFKNKDKKQSILNEFERQVFYVICRTLLTLLSNVTVTPTLLRAQTHLPLFNAGTTRGERKAACKETSVFPLRKKSKQRSQNERFFPSHRGYLPLLVLLTFEMALGLGLTLLWLLLNRDLFKSQVPHFLQSLLDVLMHSYASLWES